MPTTTVQVDHSKGINTPENVSHPRQKDSLNAEQDERGRPSTQASPNDTVPLCFLLTLPFLVKLYMNSTLL